MAQNDSADQKLLLAAEKGDLSMVKSAFAEGASFNARNSLNNTPLCTTASAGHLDVVKFLVEQGTNIQLAGYCDMTALTLAARDADSRWSDISSHVERHPVSG